MLVVAKIHVFCKIKEFKRCCQFLFLIQNDSTHPLFIVNLFDDKPNKFTKRELPEYFDIAQQFAVLAGKVLNDTLESFAGKVDIIKSKHVTLRAYLEKLNKIIRSALQCEASYIFWPYSDRKNELYFIEECNPRLDQSGRYTFLKSELELRVQS